MSFRVVVTRRAERAIREIYDWIAERSPGGAERWYASCREAIGSLCESPDRCPSADHDVIRGYQLRQHFFRTHSGRKFRLIFTLFEQEARILDVRGPDQEPLAE